MKMEKEFSEWKWRWKRRLLMKMKMEKEASEWKLRWIRKQVNENEGGKGGFLTKVKMEKEAREWKWIQIGVKWIKMEKEASNEKWRWEIGLVMKNEDEKQG